jgi:hypothetical protein
MVLKGMYTFTQNIKSKINSYVKFSWKKSPFIQGRRSS